MNDRYYLDYPEGAERSDITGVERFTIVVRDRRRPWTWVFRFKHLDRYTRSVMQSLNNNHEGEIGYE